jgi:PTS system nitrogen regulatory IIA component
MKIADLLGPANVFLNVRARDKRDVLADLAGRAASILGLDRDALVKALLQREGLGSTAMGGGVALPHARVAEVRRPFAIVVRLAKAVDFEAIDGKPVDIVVLAMLPTTAAEAQMPALACIARTLRNAELVARLRSTPTASGAYDILTTS